MSPGRHLYATDLILESNQLRQGKPRELCSHSTRSIMKEAKRLLIRVFPEASTATICMILSIGDDYDTAIMK